MADPPPKYSAIPQLPPERIAELRVQVLRFIYETGSPPDHSVPAAKIETELGLSRDEMRAVHMAILTEGLVAERARMGHIGLSGPGQIKAKALFDPQPEED